MTEVSVFWNASHFSTNLRNHLDAAFEARWNEGMNLCDPRTLSLLEYPLLLQICVKYLASSNLSFINTTRLLADAVLNTYFKIRNCQLL